MGNLCPVLFCLVGALGCQAFARFLQVLEQLGAVFIGDASAPTRNALGQYLAGVKFTVTMWAMDSAHKVSK